MPVWEKLNIYQFGCIHEYPDGKPPIKFWIEMDDTRYDETIGYSVTIQEAAAIATAKAIQELTKIPSS